MEALSSESSGFPAVPPPVDENGNRLPIPAAALSRSSRNTYLSSGIRPTADSPTAALIVDMMNDLPFKATDENGLAN